MFETHCLSKSNGIGGVIKRLPEEFVVKEITNNGTTLELNRRYSPGELGLNADGGGRFATFVLQKSGWSTIQALCAIAKRLRRGVKSIGYAGMKDRIAVSTQLASVFGVGSEELLNTRISDLRINGAWQSESGVEIGGLLGNAFEVGISDTRAGGGAIESILEELDSRIPNYFDAQRFGARGNNFRIGMCILNNNIEEAVVQFLTSYENESNREAVDARRRLADELDFNKALEYFPKYLKHERTVLYRLAREKKDFAGALRALPRGIRTIFIHSVEALIFNAAVELMIREDSFGEAKLSCTLNSYGFPDLDRIARTRTGSDGGLIPVCTLVGYKTREEELNEYEKGVIERLGIGPESFRISSIPELSMKGAYRAVLAPFKDFRYTTRENSVDVGFSLPAGSYATILLNELTKNSDLDLNRIAPGLG